MVVGWKCATKRAADLVVQHDVVCLHRLRRYDQKHGDRHEQWLEYSQPPQGRRELNLKNNCIVKFVHSGSCDPDN